MWVCLSPQLEYRYTLVELFIKHKTIKKWKIDWCFVCFHFSFFFFPPTTWHKCYLCDWLYVIGGERGTLVTYFALIYHFFTVRTNMEYLIDVLGDRAFFFFLHPFKNARESRASSPDQKAAQTQSVSTNRLIKRISIRLEDRGSCYTFRNRVQNGNSSTRDLNANYQ